MQDWRILFFAGRFHCYQGLSAFEASLPVRIASACGCPRIVLTCAAGGVNPRYQPGDFVWVSDHINLLGDNPLQGLSEEAFVDLGHLYAKPLYGPLQTLADAQGIVLHEGVLAAMRGPSYETPAEVRMLSLLGADIVSMSVAHEAIMACHLGFEVAGLSLIANRAAGLSASPLCHRDVLDRAVSSSGQACTLFEGLISTWRQCF
jgi:purine-nucleoside phosphorylase